MFPARLLVSVSCLMLLGASLASGDDLPRQGFFGLQVAALTDSAKTAAGYRGEGGVLIVKVLPGGSAAAKKVNSGIVFSVNGTVVASPPEFVKEVRKLRAGQSATLGLWKDKKTKMVSVPLVAFAKQASPDFNVVYDVVEGTNARYRLILTHPKGTGPFPTLYIVQGLGCFSMEGSIPGQSPYWPFIERITRHGYAVAYVDKPGTGDSEGGPCSDVDFDGELVAYKAALAAFSRYPFVKQDEIFILGHSMGGIMAPLLAPGTHVRGVIVYGTGVKNWMEYEIENNRKQLLLSGEDPAQVEEDMKKEHIIASEFYVEGRPLEEIVAAHPELKEDFPNPPYMYAGKLSKYFQEINQMNLPREWQKVEARVLALWGASDFVSYPDEHQAIADIVNGKHPGNAVFWTMPGTDHWMNRVESRKASMEAGPMFENFNPALPDTMLAWMDSVRK
jgi:pimeloyl-ACP methyl ester carboxylesterase